jgi:hypothetical protein
MSGDYFSVLVILILQRFDISLHASLMMICLYNMFLLFFLNKIKFGGRKCREYYFFLGESDIACIFA